MVAPAVCCRSEELLLLWRVDVVVLLLSCGTGEFTSSLERVEPHWFAPSPPGGEGDFRMTSSSPRPHLLPPWEKVRTG